MYEVLEIRSMQEIRDLFPNGIADERNWLLLSTGGIHGSVLTIEDCEYILRGENLNSAPLGNGKTLITILIVHPMLCVLRWGEIQCGLDDLTYLRRLVRSSIKSIQNSQVGNV